MKTQRLHIQGRVQGVWFRESMRAEAERLGVTGWVRNAPDGSVEAVVQGPDTAVDALIAWVRIGPPQARVDRIDQVDAQGDFSGFVKRMSIVSASREVPALRATRAIKTITTSVSHGSPRLTEQRAHK